MTKKLYSIIFGTRPFFRASSFRHSVISVVRPYYFFLRKKPAVHLDHLPGSFFGPSTLVELLQHRALHQGSDMGFRFLTDGEKEAVEWTYADLDRKARAIAASLQSMGLEGRTGVVAVSFGT